MSALGPPVSDPARIALPRLAGAGANAVAGQVLRADRFGNVMSSLAWFNWLDDGLLEFDPWLPGEVQGRRFAAAHARVTVTAAQASARHTFEGIRRTFSDVAPGEAAAVIGSERYLDFVVNRGSAFDQLGLRPGDEVLLELPGA
jgi:S-adenosylmethionine hydrolase